MTLQEFRDLLLTINVPVYHYESKKETGNYIIWAEDGQGQGSYANNHMILQEIQGTLDYYTKTEFDPIFDQIQATLNSADIAWRLNSIQREKGSGYIHYEWIWSVVNKFG